MSRNATLDLEISVDCYATFERVEAYIPWVTLNSTTRPSKKQALTVHIRDNYDLMNGMLKEMGYVVPIPSSASHSFSPEDLEWLKTFLFDPNTIFVGGYSAGAVTAIHLAYIDEINDLPISPINVQNIVNNIGGQYGIEGDAGNYGYPSDVSGVISIAGGINNIDWIDAFDEPLVSVQGTSDLTVNYNCGPGMNNPLILTLCGSGEMHPKADMVGIINDKLIFTGENHSWPAYGNSNAKFVQAIDFITNFLSLVSSISNIGISLQVDQTNLNFIYILLVIVGGSFFSTSSGLRFLKIYSLSKYSMNQILSFSRPKNVFMNKLVFSKINFDTKDINKYFLTVLIFIISLFSLTIILSFANLRFENSFKLAVLTLMNTVNSSAYGIPDFDFNNLHYLIKFFLIIFMIIGRVELLSLILIAKKFLFKY